MKKTKIIATIGPNSNNKETIREMVLSGCDVIRINLSHASSKFCDDVIDLVREIERELNKPIGIMLDTNGPSVRLDEIKEEKVFLKKDREIKLYSYPVLCNNTQISVNYGEIVSDLEIGNVLLLNDGTVSIEVIDIFEDYVLCKIIDEGYIYSRQSVHLKNGSFNIPFMNKPDYDSILYGIKKNIDFLALSYVRDEQDVLMVVDMLIENGNSHMAIISKIETANAVNNIEEILKVSDGVMVARGDLGIELSLERLPYFQKTILNHAREQEKISIVATDLLESMENNDQPSRAEVSDIYNAVMDKCDAVMLSGETTTGNYPIEAVKTMTRVIESAEEDFDYLDNLNMTLRDIKQDITSSIAYSVVDSSLRLSTSAIIANTNSGYTARKISHFRPMCPVLGLSPSIETIRLLTLVYGIIPVQTNECQSTDTIVKMCVKVAKKTLNLVDNDIVIVTGGFPISNKNTNFMKIEVINQNNG